MESINPAFAALYHLDLIKSGGHASLTDPKFSAALGRDRYIVTYFLPMRGNPLSEIGSLLYMPEF
jgi:hypothetical protein